TCGRRAQPALQHREVPRWSRGRAAWARHRRGPPRRGDCPAGLPVVRRGRTGAGSCIARSVRSSRAYNHDACLRTHRAMAMTLVQFSLPLMNGAVRKQVAEVADALHQRADDLAADLARAIMREVRMYQAAAPVPYDVVVEGCAANMRPVLEAIAAGTEF